MLGPVMCEGLCCLSAPSDHDSTLCPRVGVRESTSTFHRHRLIRASASHQHWTSVSSQPVAISLLYPTQPVISISPSPEQQCLASFLHTACWLQLLLYPPYCTLDPFSLTALCPSPHLTVNHHPLCFFLAQSQDPVNQKTWLMELSLLLTTWAPLSCCLRGIPPRTFAWCRPRRLSAGSRYSKTHPHTPSHTDSHIKTNTHCVFGLKESISILLITQLDACLQFCCFPSGGVDQKSPRHKLQEGARNIWIDPVFPLQGPESKF